MIGYIKGTLVEKGLAEVTIDVQGIGYAVQVPMSTLFQLPELNTPIKLHTHLSIREDAHVLYGFHTLQDRTVFRQLIRVNGVGPKMALAILSGMDSSDLIQVVQNNDLSSLVNVPGVGKKTAERLLIELRDRLKDLQPRTAEPARQAALEGQDNRQDAESALVSLGYKPALAAQMVKKVYQPDMSSDMIIRNALKSMVSQ